jgi:hypothetical protein
MAKRLNQAKAALSSTDTGVSTSVLWAGVFNGVEVYGQKAGRLPYYSCQYIYGYHTFN